MELNWNTFQFKSDKFDNKHLYWRSSEAEDPFQFRRAA